LLEAEHDRVQQAYNVYYAKYTDPEEIYSAEREEGVARKSSRLQEQERVVTVVHLEATWRVSSGDYSSNIHYSISL
jgi:hypothetical protein